MSRLIGYAIVSLVLVSQSPLIASAGGGRGSDGGGGLGSTASQYTGRGYWPEMGQSNSPLGGQQNTMTQPTAPWLTEPNIPTRWRATEMAKPDRPAPAQSESQPQTPGGTVEMSGATPQASGSSFTQ